MAQVVHWATIAHMSFSIWSRQYCRLHVSHVLRWPGCPAIGGRCVMFRMRVRSVLDTMAWMAPSTVYLQIKTGRLPMICSKFRCPTCTAAVRQSLTHFCVSISFFSASGLSSAFPLTARSLIPFLLYTV